MNKVEKIINIMRKEWIKQNNKLKESSKKEIVFVACYYEGYKDGIEKCYKILEKELQINNNIKK